MKRIRVALIVMGALVGMSLPARAIPAVVFTLNPTDGVLAGQAGTAVGWGFTLTVNDGNYVTIEGINFAESFAPIGVFSTPGLPSSTAWLSNPILGPWFINSSGLQYDIFNSAILNASTQGTLTLVYDTFSDQALTDQIGFADSVNATLAGDDLTVSVTVNQEAVNTPEPGAMGLIGIGVGLMGCVKKRAIQE